MIFSQTQRSRVVTSSQPSNRPTVVTTTRITGAWCLSTLAILKWLEIICCVIIVVLLQPILFFWTAYSYMVFVATSCFLTVLVTLIIYFLQLHNGALRNLPWKAAEVTTNILMVILLLFAFAVAIYDCATMYSGSFAHHNHHHDSGVFSTYGYTDNDLKHRMAAISALFGASCVLFSLSAWYASRGYL